MVTWMRAQLREDTERDVERVGCAAKPVNECFIDASKEEHAAQRDEEQRTDQRNKEMHYEAKFQR